MKQPANEPGPSAIVLAGGRSQRMGQPKAMLKFGEATLLEVIVGRLINAFKEVIVVAPPATLAEMALAAPAGARLVHDVEPFQGPLAGLGAESRRPPAIRSSHARAICRC